MRNQNYWAYKHKIWRVIHFVPIASFKKWFFKICLLPISRAKCEILPGASSLYAKVSFKKRFFKICPLPVFFVLCQFVPRLKTKLTHNKQTTDKGFVQKRKKSFSAILDNSFLSVGKQAESNLGAVLKTSILWAESYKNSARADKMWRHLLDNISEKWFWLYFEFWGEGYASSKLCTHIRISVSSTCAENALINNFDFPSSLARSFWE